MRAWFQRLKLRCDEPLSNFTFNFNLRRYIMAPVFGRLMVGRCRLIVSKLELKARLVSALEAEM